MCITNANFEKELVRFINSGELILAAGSSISSNSELCDDEGTWIVELENYGKFSNPGYFF